MRNRISMAFDVLLFGTPLLLGTAFIAPFVAIDLTKELIKDRLRDRENY